MIAIGRTGIDTCPVSACETWIEAAGLSDGRAVRRLGRHDHLGERLWAKAVAEIVQRRTARVGLEQTSFLGHSTRAGFATSAAAAGVEERIIMKTTRHRSTTMLRRYIHDGQLFERNLAAEVGL